MSSSRSLLIKNPEVRRKFVSIEYARVSAYFGAQRVNLSMVFVALLAVVMSEEGSHPLKSKSMSNACVNGTYGVAVRCYMRGVFELLIYRAAAEIGAYHGSDCESRSFLGLGGLQGMPLVLDWPAARFSHGLSTPWMRRGPACNIGNVDCRNECFCVQNSVL